MIHLGRAYWRLRRKSQQGVRSVSVTTAGSLAYKLASFAPKPYFEKVGRNDSIHGPKRAGGRGLHPRQAPGSPASAGSPYPKGAHLKPVALLRRRKKRACG